MTHHNFLFSPSAWLGQGSISFNVADDKPSFHTRWIGKALAKNEIPVVQEIEIEGFDKKIKSQYFFFNITSNSFDVEMKNDIVGTVLGKGVINPKKIAWEFRDSKTGFEGIEIFEIQPDGTYLTHAEFTTPDLYRTIVHGKVWRGTDKSKD